MDWFAGAMFLLCIPIGLIVVGLLINLWNEKDTPPGQW